MPQSVLERTGELIAESAGKASRTTSAVADAIEDGIGKAKRAAREGRNAAEELLNDTTQHIKRHPVQAVVATFAVGLSAGILIGWLTRRT
jgi:ElaB/YqjD/DUF883 family membrane-anchored ribosome-binding protein